jgi:hypothetical protein
MPEQWQPDESVFDRVNLVGTKEVLARCATRACELAIVFATLAIEPMWPERGGCPMPPGRGTSSSDQSSLISRRFSEAGAAKIWQEQVRAALTSGAV